MVPAGNKAKCLSSVNHTTKIIIIIKQICSKLTAKELNICKIGDGKTI